MADSPSTDVQRLIEHIDATLSPERPAWPGGYPDQIELALIDAVLSIRAQYGSATSGVRRCVRAYAASRQSSTPDDLSVLADLDVERLRDLLDTRQVTAGTPKHLAISQAAERLVKVGVVHASDLRPDSAEQQRAYCSVRGLGPVTWEYLLMLSHHPGVKADRWIRRFVSAALDRTVHADEAGPLVKVAAVQLGLTATQLDYAIWHHQSRGRRASD